jgi:hypothetical protein
MTANDRFIATGAPYFRQQALFDFLWLACVPAWLPRDGEQKRETAIEKRCRLRHVRIGKKGGRKPRPRARALILVAILLLAALLMLRRTQARLRHSYVHHHRGLP